MEENYKFAERQIESWMKAKSSDQLCEFLEFLALHITNKSVINDIVQIFLFLEQVNQSLIADKEFLTDHQKQQQYVYNFERDTILNRKLREVLVLIEQDVQKYLCDDRDILKFIQKEFEYLQVCCTGSITPFREQITQIVNMIYSTLTALENIQN